MFGTPSEDWPLSRRAAQACPPRPRKEAYFTVASCSRIRPRSFAGEGNGVTICPLFMKEVVTDDKSAPQVRHERGGLRIETMRFC